MPTISVPTTDVRPLDRPIKFRRLTKCAYLDYAYEGKRDGNIGGEIVAKLVARIAPLDRITADQINDYDCVLVSIPSSSQMVDVLKLALQHRFDRRKCRIVVGGYGVQNVNLLRGHVDYAFFGRAHDCVEQIIDSVAEGAIHPDVADNMIAVDAPHIVRFRQAPLLSDRVLEEEFTGCPLKCKFCHYTYARKFNGKTSGYVQSMLMGGTSDEVLYADIAGFKEKRGRLRTAIDGFSERLRYLYGKRISNDMIVDGVNHLGEIAYDHRQDDMFGGHELNKRTVMMVCNIVNFPYERPDDEQEFIANIQRANPRTRVIFILQSTPFRASPATPMQWERVQIYPDWSAKSQKTICDRPNLLVKYSYTLEGPWSQLLAAITERARDCDPVAMAAINYRSGKTVAIKAAEFMERHDVSHHIGEHDIYGPPPGAWYIKSYLRDEQIVKIAEKMRRVREGWSRPGASDTGALSDTTGSTDPIQGGLDGAIAKPA